MYFMSSNDFDLLFGGIVLKQIELIEILEHAVQSDMNPETEKFDFNQHLYEKYPDLGLPNWLIEE